MFAEAPATQRVTKQLLSAEWAASAGIPALAATREKALLHPPREGILTDRYSVATLVTDMGELVNGVDEGIFVVRLR